MEKLENYLANENQNPARCSSRIVCAQHLTCLSMEALGAGLSMDPNVFSHHIGMTFKEIEKNTSIAKLCNTKIENIPTSVGVWERDRNLQIMRKHLGRFQFANVDHAKDLTARKSLFNSIYKRQDYPMTISVDIPRTIYVQGYQEEDDRASVVGRRLRSEPWGLQDPIVHRRSARQRFADDSMICDQQERYSQNGLDVLQHVTIHVTNDSKNPEGQQGKSFDPLSSSSTGRVLILIVLVLFPPYPEPDGDNDPFLFLDNLSMKETTKSFEDFCRAHHGNGPESTAQPNSEHETQIQDVEVFANDMLSKNKSGTMVGVKDAVHLVRSYALNAWFDRIQSLENQLQDLRLDSSREYTHDEELHRYLDKEPRSSDERNPEKGIVAAILHYISSLDLECHRLSMDIRAVKESGSEPHTLLELNRLLDKYTFIRSRMDHLLAQARHRLEMQTIKMQDSSKNPDIRKMGQKKAKSSRK